MRLIFLLLLLFFPISIFAQLGFCEGSKGDPIFQETFGSGNNFGPALPTTVTNYTYVSGFPNDGQYTISTLNQINNSSWHSYLPQTTVSNGRALIVNASYDSGLFYQTEISGLCQNTTYEFSAFLLNVYDRSSNVCQNGGIPLNVRFEIWDETNSVILKQGSTGNITSSTNPEWESFGLTFRSKVGQESIILKMYNNGDGGCGNDLAIDDIIFRSCGDLTSITYNGSGSGLDFCEEEIPEMVTLDATSDSSVYTTQFYQWQKSGDGETWVDIPGETADSYTFSVSASFYYRVKVAEDKMNLKNNLCSSASKVFPVRVVQTPAPPISNGDIKICSNQTFPLLSVSVEDDETVNWYDAPTGGNLLAENSLTYLPLEPGTYYAEARKVDYSCNPGKRTAISFNIFSAPVARDEKLVLCENSTLNLDAGPPNMNYLWSTGEQSQIITISTAGIYTVVVTNSNNCSTTKTIEVIAVEHPVIKEIHSEQDMVSIILEKPGDFEYSLDGINFQKSNIFKSVAGGIYTAFVRDLNGCSTVTKQFVHLVVPELVTPNGDGYNDYFEIKGIGFYTASKIKIFNRYGKLLKMGKGENFRWNGTFGGKDLPTNDYWYFISISGFEPIKGHFSLIR